MKILVIRDGLPDQRLTAALKTEGITVDTVNELRLALESVQTKHYDLAIIDSLFKNAEQVCDCIFNLTSIPVTLMLSDTVNDWKLLSTFKVKGFLPKEASNNELRSRVKAACRRNQLVKMKI